MRKWTDKGKVTSQEEVKALAELTQGKLEMTEKVGFISVNPPTFPVKLVLHDR